MAQDIATAAPTDSDGVSTGGNVDAIVDYWVDKTERWLWQQPRQALLNDDYAQYLTALQKRLKDL